MWIINKLIYSFSILQAATENCPTMWKPNAVDKVYSFYLFGPFIVSVFDVMYEMAHFFQQKDHITNFFSHIGREFTFKALLLENNVKYSSEDFYDKVGGFLLLF